MVEGELNTDADILLEQMKESRDVAAVLKLKLISLRSSDPTLLALAFEGIDDKKIYFHWIQRVNPELSYEPFVCGGKGPLLRFLDALRRDRGNAREGVYFFMDRDFDDFRGVAPGPEIFMTATYSFENQLVQKEVLEELLKDEFHCHGEPVCRGQVLQLFDSQYDSFVEATRELNFRLFAARQLGIEVKNMPDKLNTLANVELANISALEKPLEEVLPLAAEPTPDERTSLRPAFDSLEPRARYRGKFCLLFFRRWLRLLAADRNNEMSKLFAGLTREGFKAPGEISLDSLAAKSLLPDGFSDFIKSISPPAATA